MLGHSVMRLYVMGPDAWDRAATDDERAQLAALLDESVAAGAFGFSTSFFDADAQAFPSRAASPTTPNRGTGRGAWSPPPGLIEFIPNTQAHGGDREVSIVERAGVTAS